jgi:hypothetical protein
MYPAETGQQQQQGGQPMQAAPVMQQAMQVAVPVGMNNMGIGMAQLELQSKASGVFRLWCCYLIFGLITLISGLILGGQRCSSSYDASTLYSCNTSAWKLYAPAIAFGGVISILSIVALRALNCSSCAYNVDVATYDLKILRPLLFIGSLSGVGLLIWSAYYLILGNVLSIVVFPWFIPCWAGCVAGILAIVQVSCCQRQMQMHMDSLHIVGNQPPTILVQPQFIQPQMQMQMQMQPQFVQPQYNPYGQQPVYGQQPAYGQQPYGQQPPYGQAVFAQPVQNNNVTSYN